MEERIITLLTMCMQAKKLGYEVHFDYKPNVDWIQIYSFNEDGSFNKHIWFYTFSGVDQPAVKEVTNYLQELLTGGVNG